MLHFPVGVLASRSSLKGMRFGAERIRPPPPSPPAGSTERSPLWGKGAPGYVCINTSVDAVTRAGVPQHYGGQLKRPPNKHRKSTQQGRLGIKCHRKNKNLASAGRNYQRRHQRGWSLLSMDV
jgi:hypothetical protein